MSLSQPPEPLSSPSLEQDGRWFEEHAQPHGPQLKVYLRNSFPRLHDVDDVVQESFLRLWKTRATEPIRAAKAFLFNVARHLAVDLARRDRIAPVTAVADLAGLEVEEERAGVAERLGAQERLQLLGEAIGELAPRCRAAILLCKVEGLSHREAAQRLGVSVKTVDEQVLRGIRKLGNILRRRGVDGSY